MSSSRAALESSKYLEGLYYDFSTYVNETRNIPRLSDGLTDVKRIALWLLRNKDSKIKTMALAGEMIASKLYVHGDVSAAAAISGMAAPNINNVCLVDGDGNFGSTVAPRAWSAPRYTDVQRAKIAERLLYADIDTLEMKDNYDGSVKMPVEFRPVVPLLLVNGFTGVGVGYSCTIFPRSLENITKATIAAINDKPIDPEWLYPVFEPLGQKAKPYKIDKKGNQTWEFEGSVEIIDNRTVAITGLPAVGLTLEELKTMLGQMEANKMIYDYEDRSTKKIRVVVKFQRGHCQNWTSEDAIEFFKLRRRSTENIWVIGFTGRQIVQYVRDETHAEPDPIARMIKDWVKWRLPKIDLRIQTEIADQTRLLNLNAAFVSCFNSDLPSIARSCQSRAEVIDKAVAMTEGQFEHDIMERVVDRPTHSWNKRSFEDAAETIRKATADIEVLSKALGNEKEWRKRLLKSIG